ADVVDNIHVGAPRTLDLRALGGALETLNRRMELAKRKSGPGGSSEEVLAISRATAALLGRLNGSERGVVEVALGDYQARLAEDFAQQWQRLQRATRPAPITLADLPQELRRKIIRQGRHLLLPRYSRL